MEYFYPFEYQHQFIRIVESILHLLTLDVTNMHWILNRYQTYCFPNWCIQPRLSYYLMAIKQFHMFTTQVPHIEWNNVRSSNYTKNHTILEAYLTLPTWHFLRSERTKIYHRPRQNFKGNLGRSRCQRLYFITASTHTLLARFPCLGFLASICLTTVPQRSSS